MINLASVFFGYLLNNAFYTSLDHPKDRSQPEIRKGTTYLLCFYFLLLLLLMINVKFKLIYVENVYL